VQIWNNLENYWETANALHGTNNTLLSYKLNRVIYILTAFSVCFLPVNLIAFIFGMNAANFPPVFHKIQVILSMMAGVMLITALFLVILMKRGR